MKNPPKTEDSKKWLTCQITQAENTALEEYCKNERITKTEVIRDFLRNIEQYSQVIKLIRQKVLTEVVQQLNTPDILIKEETIDQSLIPIPPELEYTLTNNDLYDLYDSNDFFVR